MIQLLRLLLLGASFCLVAVAAAAQARLPDALQAAIAATAAQRVDYAFDLELVSAKLNWRAHFDPARSPKLRLVSPSRETMSSVQRAAFDRQAEDMEGLAWCANEYMGRVADMRLLRENAESATYAFQPTRESVRSEQAKRYADRMRGEATIAKANPDIVSSRVYMPEAFSPFPLVRLNTIDIRITCAPAPNGRYYAAEVVTNVSGSGFGQDFSDRSVQRISNLRALR